ncbi:hypothetical protein K490DRAFT_32884, partial [Saccharata proteae CBS 121410]
TRFELGIWYALQAWPALTVAIQSQFGGPNGADKRDWLAGAIADIFDQNPETDAEDVEMVLLQVMEDEFEVRLEDESEVPIAANIFKMKQEIAAGEYTTVDQMERRWQKRRGKGPNLSNVQVIQQGTTEDDSGDSVDDEEASGDEGDDDVEMGDAPPAPPKPKPEPEVDEDGFTKVVGKKRH